MGIEFTGVDALADELRRLSEVRFDAVCQKSMTQIYNRGKAPGGTPVDTGELRLSLGQSGSGADSEVGYTKDYAPHVEYGHRTRGGGYVQGRHFLKRNVDAQRPIFQKDLRDQIGKFR